MLAIVKRFMPGERIRMILIAACIGVMSGLASIVLREAVDLVHKVFFVWGYEALGIAEAGWRRLLLPLLQPGPTVFHPSAWRSWSPERWLRLSF